MRIITFVLRRLPGRHAGRHRAIPPHPVFGPLQPVLDGTYWLRPDAIIIASGGNVFIHPRRRVNGRYLGTRPRRNPAPSTRPQTALIRPYIGAAS